MKKTLALFVLAGALLLNFNASAQQARWNYDSRSSQIDGSRVIYINGSLPYQSNNSYPTLDFPITTSAFISTFVSNSLYLVPILPRQNLTIRAFTSRSGGGGSNTNVLWGLYDADSQNLPRNLIAGSAVSQTITAATGYYDIRMPSDVSLQRNRLYYYGVLYNTSWTIPSVWPISPGPCAFKFSELVGGSTTSVITGISTAGCGYIAGGVSYTVGLSPSIVTSTLAVGNAATGAPFFRMVVK